MNQQTTQKYLDVQDWKDLCKTNLDFLKNRIPSTFYCCEPVDEETTDILPTLIKLNKKRLFTINSQPHMLTADTEQISFVEFNCEQEIAYKLLPKLLMSDDLYFSFGSVSPEKPAWIDTFPTDSSFNLTRFKNIDKSGKVSYEEYTNWNKFTMIGMNTISEPEICGLARCTFTIHSEVYNLLLDSVSIFVSGKEFGTEFSAPDKVLELISE